MMNDSDSKVVRQYSKEATTKCLNKPFHILLRNRFQSAAIYPRSKMYGKAQEDSGGGASYPALKADFFKKSVLETPETHFFIVGANMEEAKVAFDDLNVDLSKSRDFLRETVNEMKATSETVFKELAEMRETSRQTRMAITSELNQSLSVFKDIRKFFLDSDYKEEIERLERFVSVCKELKRLKDDGTLDLISNTVIGLSLKEKIE